MALSPSCALATLRRAPRARARSGGRDVCARLVDTFAARRSRTCARVSMGGAGEQERSWVVVVCVGSCPRSVWRSPPCRGYRARARSRQEAAAAEARCEAEADINPIYNPKASFGRELAGRHRARADGTRTAPPVARTHTSERASSRERCTLRHGSAPLAGQAPAPRARSRAHAHARRERERERRQERPWRRQQWRCRRGCAAHAGGGAHRSRTQLRSRCPRAGIRP